MNQTQQNNPELYDDEKPFYLTFNGVPMCQFFRKEKSPGATRGSKYIAADQKKVDKINEKLGQIGRKLVCHYYITDESEITKIENAVRLGLPSVIVKMVEGYHDVRRK